jgi:glycosyltransferase involved in cell wall biosynthesis
LEKKKLKIALVANSSWNIYNFRLNVLDILIEKGYEVIVLAPLDIYSHYGNEFPTVRHIPLRFLARRSLNPFHDLAFVFELFSIYRKEKPDILLHYTIKPNIYGGIVSRFLGLPTIACITGLGYTFINTGFVHGLTKQLYKFAFGRVERVIFENIDDRLLFDDLKIVEAAKSVSVKGCGINIERFYPMPHWEKSLQNARVFTFIGRFLHDKGIVEFVEAAKLVKQKYPETLFWLVGEIDNDNPAAIHSNILRGWILDGLIENKGFMDDVRPFIAASDCIVCPSYREGMPRVLLEGMAMERAIITTDVPGCREAVVDGVNGFLVTVKSAQALADAMCRLIELTDEGRAEMGKKGREKVMLEFDQQLIAADILTIIETVIRNTSTDYTHRNLLIS